MYLFFFSLLVLYYSQNRKEGTEGTATITPKRKMIYTIIAKFQPLIFVLIVLFFYLQPTVFMNSWFVSVCDPSYFSSRLERNVLDLGIKLNKLAQGKYVWRLQIYGCIRNFLYYYTCTNNMLKSYSRIFIKNWSIYYNDLNFKSKSNYKFWCSEMGEKLQIGEIIQIMMKT